MKTFKTLFYLSLLLLTAFSAASQTIRERYRKAESFLPKNISKLVSNIELRPHWIEESSDFWYVEETPGGSKYMLFDSKKGTSQPAFDQQAIAKLVGEKIDQAVSPDSLHLDDLKFAATKKSIHFRLKDERIFIELPGYTITKTEKIEPKTPAYESVSPDQKWTVSLKNYNLCLKDSSTGEESALTTDGIEKYEYANPANNWEKLIDLSKGDSYDPHIDIQWSADSKKIVTFKIDRRKVGLMYLCQSIPDSGYRAKVLAYERAIPGEDAIMQEFCVFDPEKKKQIKLDIPSVPDICVSFGPQWIDGSDELMLGVYQRGYQSQDLYIANANTGQAKIILREQAQTMI